MIGDAFEDRSYHVHDGLNDRHRDYRRSALVLRNKGPVLDGNNTLTPRSRVSTRIIAYAMKIRDTNSKEFSLVDLLVLLLEECNECLTW